MANDNAAAREIAKATARRRLQHEGEGSAAAASPTCLDPSRFLERGRWNTPGRPVPTKPACFDRTAAGYQCSRGFYSAHGRV